MSFNTSLRKTFIAFFVAISLLLGGVLYLFENQKINILYANESVYGTQMKEGHFVKKGVVFYAVKVRKQFNQKTHLKMNPFSSTNISTNEYWPEYEVVTKNDGTPFYVNFNDTVLLAEDEYVMISLARQLPTESESKTIVSIIDNRQVTIEMLKNAVEDENTLKGQDSDYNGSTDVKNWLKMKVGSNQFKVYYQEEGEDKEKVYSFCGHAYKYLNDNDLELDENDSTKKKNYYNTYDHSEKEISTSSGSYSKGQADKIYYARNENGNASTLSAPIDFLTVNLEIDGAKETDTIIQGAEKKQFGYIINLNDSSMNRNKEGYVDMMATYKVTENQKEVTDTFIFNFYVFKESTYKNVVEDKRKGAPGVTINLNAVNDSSLSSIYYSEFFYYFQRSESASLTYNHERYEIGINKSIHSTSTDYQLTYNQSTKEIKQTIDKGVSTSPYYAQEFITQNIFVKKNEPSIVLMYSTEENGETIFREENGNILQVIKGSSFDSFSRKFKRKDGDVIITEDKNGNFTQEGIAPSEAEVLNNYTRILFRDIAEYKVSYKAIYFKDGFKTYLNALNNSALRDKITVFGWQLTYKDVNKGQKELKSVSGEIHSDFTSQFDSGIIKENKEGYVSTVLNIPKSVLSEIPSTNQPPAYFMFNSELQSSTSYKIYKFESEEEDLINNSMKYTFTEQKGSIYSFFTKTGKYFITIDSVYNNFKSQSGNNVSHTSLKMKQYFIFDVTNTTPSLKMTKLDEDGLSTSEEILNGKFVKHGVEIEPTQKAGIFDSTTRISVYKKSFTQISYPQTPSYIINSTDLGNTKISSNGNYKVVLEYGIYNSITDKYNNELISYFIIDNDDISGLTAYNVEKIAGSTNYFASTDPLKKFTKFSTTNEIFSLFWNAKPSGAKISASYQIYSIKHEMIKEGAIANDYRLNDWVLVDYAIDVTQTSTIPYSRAESTTTIRANNVLNDSGLYVFKLTDEAGNVEFFSIIYDSTSPKMLQKEQNAENFVDVSRFNYISTNTEVFYGTHKAIKFNFGSFVSDARSYIKSNILKSDLYIKEIFDEDANVDSELISYNSLYSGGPETLYFTVPITKVSKYLSGELFKPQPSLSEKKNLLEIRFIEGNRIAEEEYLYYIYDQSNRTKTPSLVYKLTVSTDLSGCKIYYETGDEKSDGVSLYGTETSVRDSSRYMYFRAIASKVVILFRYKAEPSDVVLIDKVVCEYYPLEYDALNRTYKYSTVPKIIPLEGEIDADGYVVCEIKMPSGYTSEGKYIIKRTYTEESRNEITQDYMTRGFVVFVDNEKDLVSTPEGSDDIQTGAYAGMILFHNIFDSSNKPISVYFNELYRQNQKDNTTVVFASNKSPILFSIPYAKYGTVVAKRFDSEGNEILVSNGEMAFSITSNLLSLKDNMYFDNLDENKSFFPYFTVARVLRNGVLVDYVTVNKDGYISLNNITQPGSYTLEIGCIQDQNDLAAGKYLQYFFFNFEVVTLPPDFEFTANYSSDLTQISSNKIEVMPDNFYYSNADNIVVSWIDPNDNFMSKVDKSKISYSIGGMNVNLNQNQIMKDPSNENGYYFTINGPFYDGTLIGVTMQYEGKASNYGPNGFKTTRTIRIDKSAPTTNLNWVASMDSSISGVSTTQLRTTGQRFNKSNILDPKYKYYSYVFDIRKLKTNESETDLTQVFKNFLDSFLVSDNCLNTQKVYIKKMPNKYSSAPYESWLPVDPDAESNSLFNPITWKLTSDYTFGNYEDEIYNNYEIVEVDSAGNMTIFSIYLVDSQNKVDMKMKYNARGVDATVDENGDYITVENTIVLKPEQKYDIFSRERFNITSIFYNTLNSNVGILEYGYYTIRIDGATYYKTPFTANYFISSKGESVTLASLILFESTKVYTIEVSNWLFSETIILNVSVIGPHEQLQYEIVRDTPTTETIGVKLFYGSSTSSSSGVKLREKDGIVVSVLGQENEIKKDLTIREFAETTIYFFSLGEEYTSGTVYVIKITDNFNATATEYVLYSTPSYQNFRGGADITPDIQNNKYIVSSESLFFYADSLYTVTMKRKEGFGDSAVFLDFYPVTRTDNGVTSYALPAPSTTFSYAGFSGGRYEYLITKTPVSDSNNATEITVVVYNYMPSLQIKNHKGDDITKILSGEVITSNSVFIYFDNSPQEFATEVLIAKRGGNDSFKPITTGFRVDDVATYDILVKFKNLAFQKEFQFTISPIDVIYYSVVMKDTFMPVKETGNSYVYVEGNKNVYVPHHYIVNGLYEIAKNNGIEVNLVKTISVTTSQAVINTYIYDISNYSSSTNDSYYVTTIAVTSIPATDNVLQGSLGYFKGDTVSGQKTTLDKSSANVFLTQDDVEDKISITFNGYYGIKENKIYYQIAKDGLWSKNYFEAKGDVCTIVLPTSARYQFRFSDSAGNIHVFPTGVGSGKVNEYTVNFVKSVIFYINNYAPIDNSIYNNEVIVSVPNYTLEYYDVKKVTLVATLNGEPVTLDKVKNTANTFSATKPGLYTVYFKANRGSRALKEEVITFTIINPNDSRWAFEYVNYNEYIINSIMLNSVDIKPSTDMKRISYSILGGGTDVSVKGFYTISISTKSEPVQTFVFSFWLNDEVPPISVSIQEGTSTTGTVDVKFNAKNIFEMVGDCSIVITGQDPIAIDQKYIEGLTEDLVTIKLVQKTTYFVQVYTNSGKLVYSYRFDIVEPLNSIAIILIVVGSIVFVIGAILFIALRKKMKVR